jgi:hypothetical protein
MNKKKNTHTEEQQHKPQLTKPARTANHQKNKQSQPKGGQTRKQTPDPTQATNYQLQKLPN